MNSANHNLDWLDASLYPDQSPPTELATLAAQIDFVARVCAAWDFGILPRPATLKRMLDNDFLPAVEQTQLLTSCAYHLLRELDGLSPARYLGPQFPEIQNDPCLQNV